jgi:hypothetical protein
MNATMSSESRLPTTIPEYLESLRAELRGADPAMIQDALYDAEEYLRSELAEQAGKSEAEVIASVAGSYGAPAEVAEIYRDTEVTRQPPLCGRRLRPNASRHWDGSSGDRRFAHLRRPVLHAVVIGYRHRLFHRGHHRVSLSLGLLVLIVGIPILVLFLA